MSIKSSLWSGYAPTFDLFHTFYQTSMYEAASVYVHGRVLDGGAGTGKFAAYCPTSVTEYVAVDAEAAMVARGQSRLNALNRPGYSFLHQRIEDTQGEFTCAVSLQSHYSWANPVKVLRQLNHLLVSNGRLVIATANDKLDIHALLEEAKKPWISISGWDEYASYNIEFAESAGGQFLSLDALIRQLHAAGFLIDKAYSELFDGGLNFIVATKK